MIVDHPKACHTRAAFLQWVSDRPSLGWYFIFLSLSQWARRTALHWQHCPSILWKAQYRQAQD